MALPFAALAFGSLLGGGGGSSSTSSSVLNNQLSFSPVVSIGGNVGQASDANLEPVSTVISDQTPKTPSTGFPFGGVGGLGSNFDEPLQAGIGGGLAMPLLLGAGVLAFFVLTGKVKK